MALRVKAGAIVVKVKGQDRYLYRGAFLPSGVDPKESSRLKSIGLVEDVKVEDSSKTEPSGDGQSQGRADDPRH